MVKILFRHSKHEKWEHLNHTGYSGETHLRDILYEDPDILPIEDISFSSTKLSRIKLMLKEVGLPGSGSTDLVGIDKSGNIFIIETKLATNPEAKRAVIGQILEYAAFLHGRELDWLDAIVRKERNGVGIMEHFEKEPDWDKEEFEQNLRDSLQEGSFILFIVVDEMNPDLKRTINYMNDVLGVRIYALELRYFKDKSGMEILVPNVYGGEKRPQPPRIWDEKSFFEEARNIVDEETQRTLRKLYDLSKRLGSVDFGSGRTIPTFKVSLPYKGKLVRFFVASPHLAWNWFAFNSMLQKGIDKQVILDYVSQLTSLGFQFDAKAIEGNPPFDLTKLNDEEKFSAFEKYTLELKEKLQKQ